ncbi:MAG: PDZ domain-containing protein [Natronospirillum sp.]|uniref:M61 family metallopeptidase n=1 Tax=Natronospirillum sp. TaxID=2812955 RepID=UPI0025FF10C5|nr:PDZ domain-containing protein [Natronospirillum sp.]MCH8552822.1 PDZ domain-containing protein [Natronospirillum sp.]
MIRYSIRPANPAAHLFRVTLTLTSPEREQGFQMPAWIPGSYMIRNFSRHIIGLQAEDEHGQTLAVRQIDKQSWALAADALPQQVTLSYDVYAWDRSVRAAHLDRTHGYFNGSSVFLCVTGREDDPCEVDILPPEAPVEGNWRVATAMTTAGAEPWSFGPYKADNYEELIDHPVEMTEFTPGYFKACGVPHHIVISGRHRVDMERLERDLQAICEHHIGFWGEPAPMRRYLFMTMATGDGYGGLEHRASTSLMAKRDDLPRPGLDAPTSGYLNYLGLCSHEYFHTWNVKRLKPAVFHPYPLQQEAYTELLWWFEGITSYYDDLGVLRAGCSTVEAYLEMLGQTITRVYRGEGRFRQTLTESSFNAWTKFYLQDENAPNAIVSYYAKGELFALLLDLAIRERTSGQQSLDDLVHAAWANWHQDGMPEDGVPELAKQHINCDLSDLFHLGLNSTDDLPLQDYLARFGVTLDWGTPLSLGMPGGKRALLKPEQVNLGAVFEADPAGARVRAVLQNSAAQQAGLSAGDVVVAVNGIQTSQGRIETQVAEFQPGDRFSLHYFRYDELRETEVTAEVGAATTAALTVNDRALARSWLGEDVRFAQREG